MITPASPGCYCHHLVPPPPPLLLQMLIRSGYTDSTVDTEVRQLLHHADEVRESDDGVTHVLLVAAQVG